MDEKVVLEDGEIFDFLTWLNEIGFAKEKKDTDELLEMTEAIKAGREAAVAVKH